MKTLRSVLVICFGLYICMGTPMRAQGKADAPIRVIVDLVQLNVAVTDKKGNYVTGLQPGDFEILEDGIPQKVATFAEGGEATRHLLDSPSGDATEATTEVNGQRMSGADLSAMTGANVFVLFDTSNYMYRGFVFAQDAIADFVRSLDGTDRVAFYSYSRDLSRASRLTEDRSTVLRSVRSTVAGDNAALYNCLLLTVKDAAQFPGRKVIVVFSNGPDDSSVVPPEDVAELAQSTGTAIYMISTSQAQLEPISTAVFERMTADTGGKVYFAKNWRDERRAFESIRDDLAHLYSLSYYPRPNPNRGWRSITVKLTSQRLKNCHIRTRNGYRLQPSQYLNASTAAEHGSR